MKSIFSIDVEDWFHILDIERSPAFSDWDKIPGRVETSFLKLLDIFASHNVHSTCFFLGWVAQKYPQLVKEAGRRGHEIASHGYRHKLVYEMTPEVFLEDAIKTRKILEDISGSAVTGYRASGFSVTEKTPWFWEKLAEAGYKYSSSAFPARRSHGGLKIKSREPHIVETARGGVIEFPISTARLLGKSMVFFGGGYLRFFPYRLIKSKADEIVKQDIPVIWYVHPREIDPGHPRLPMNLLRRFKSYYNLKSTEPKLNKILDNYEWTTFSDYIIETKIGDR